MMIVVVGIGLVLAGMAWLKRGGYLGALAVVFLGVLAVLTAIPQAMDFSTTVIDGLAAGVQSFVAQF